MHREILEQQRKLSRLFVQAKHLQGLDGIDNETKSGFVSYLCIRTSVYIESSIKSILLKYVRSKTDDTPTVNFVTASLRNLTPRRAQIISLVRQFDNVRGDSLARKTIEFGDSLNAIADNRNEIAHGEDVDLSLADLERYFGDAQEMVSAVYEQFRP